MKARFKPISRQQIIPLLEVFSYRSAYILSLIFIILTNNIKAQEENPFSRGHLFVIGSLDAEGMNEEITDPNSSGGISNSHRLFKCDIYTGYFPADYFAVGIKANMDFVRSKSGSESVLVENDISIEPFIRIYTPIGVFGEGSYGFGSYKLGLSNNSDMYQKDINKLNIGLGYSLFINKYIAVEPLISYEFRKEYNAKSQLTQKLKGLNFHIGISVFFNIISKNQKNT